MSAEKDKGRDSIYPSLLLIETENKMNAPELEVFAWSVPPEFAVYTQKGQINVQVRNISAGPIRIERIICRFECEEHLKPYVASSSLVELLKPSELSTPIFIDFEFNLAMKGSLNRYSLEIQYSGGKIFNYVSPRFITVNPICPPRDQFFISHKDPQDAKVSVWLQQFLHKLGLNGFLAEYLKNPGVDLWNDKILPAIDISVATIALFTRHAHSDPKKILKEMELSRQKGKPIILAIQKGVSKPRGIPNKIEHYTLPKRITAEDVKEFSLWIYSTYKEGKYFNRPRGK